MAKSNEDGHTWEHGIGNVEDGQRDARASLELDVAFDLLRVARRRYLLYYLSDLPEESTTIEDAVEAIQTFVTAGADQEAPPARQTVRLELLHSHLPRLEAKDILEWDPRHGEIRLRSMAPIERPLEWARRFELD